MNTPVTDVQREQDYFDRLVANEGDFNPFSDRGWKTLAKNFVEMIAPKTPLDLLDVGCGTGRSRQIYYQHTRRYVGIDLSRGALHVAHRNFSQAIWMQADACRLPFADSSFDVVAFSSVLHHIGHYRLALTEARRALRPGGQVFAFDPNLLHPAMALFRHSNSPLYLSTGVSPNERPLLACELRAAFQSAGFVQVRQHGQSDIPYRAVAPRLINACLGAYNVLDWLLDASGLGRWFGTFVLTAAIKPQESD
jgi:SAM-dependent methyltransferase